MAENVQPGDWVEGPFWKAAIQVVGLETRGGYDVVTVAGRNQGPDPTDKHLASWAGLAPGNRQSGGKRYSGRTRHMLTYRQPCRELGSDYFDQRRKEAKVSYFTRQLERLTGGSVRIEL